MASLVFLPYFDLAALDLISGIAPQHFLLCFNDKKPFPHSVCPSLSFACAPVFCSVIQSAKYPASSSRLFVCFIDDAAAAGWLHLLFLPLLGRLLGPPRNSSRQVGRG